MQLVGKDEIFPGMPFIVSKEGSSEENELKKEVLPLIGRTIRKKDI